jgi:hypothetical protein
LYAIDISLGEAFASMVAHKVQVAGLRVFAEAVLAFRTLRKGWPSTGTCPAFRTRRSDDVINTALSAGEVQQKRIGWPVSHDALVILVVRRKRYLANLLIGVAIGGIDFAARPLAPMHVIKHPCRQISSIGRAFVAAER